MLGEGLGEVVAGGDERVVDTVANEMVDLRKRRRSPLLSRFR